MHPVLLCNGQDICKGDTAKYDTFDMFKDERDRYYLPDQVRNGQQKAPPWQMPQLRRHICVATFLPAIMQLLVQHPMDIHTVQVVRSRQLLFIAYPEKQAWTRVRSCCCVSRV